MAVTTYDYTAAGVGAVSPDLVVSLNGAAWVAVADELHAMAASFPDFMVTAQAVRGAVASVSTGASVMVRLVVSGANAMRLAHVLSRLATAGGAAEASKRARKVARANASENRRMLAHEKRVSGR